MKTRLHSLLPVVISLAGLALAQDVKYNYDPGVNFSRFTTYAWVNIPGGGMDQILDQQIKSDIEGQLAAKGLTKAADQAQANVLVSYQVTTTKQKQLNWYGGWGWGGMGQANVSTTTEGTLAVDFYDPSTKQMVWRGIAEKTVNPSSNPEKNMERLNKAVTKLLKNFPPNKK